MSLSVSRARLSSAQGFAGLFETEPVGSSSFGNGFPDVAVGVGVPGHSSSTCP